MMKPSQPPPELTFAEGMAHHIACIVRDQEGRLFIATNRGELNELKPDDAANLNALMCPPKDAKVKPQ